MLAILQAFNGVSAVLGGSLLVKDPTGHSLAIRSEWLLTTPFSSFLIPGIVLFVVNGVGNLAGFWLTVRKSEQAGMAGAVLGIIMMTWIIAQVMWIGYKSALQPLYFGTGFVQMVFGYLLLKQKRIV